MFGADLVLSDKRPVFALAASDTQAEAGHSFIKLDVFGLARRQLELGYRRFGEFHGCPLFWEEPGKI